MINSPVMFVVEVVAALTTVIFVRDLMTRGANLGFTFQIILWLWFTVLFANFAEAVVEGRGEVESLRKTRTGLLRRFAPRNDEQNQETRQCSEKFGLGSSCCLRSP